MPTEFEKILNLIKKTGDKYIVGDNDENYVVMKLEQYVSLLNDRDLTNQEDQVDEDKELTQINQEITSWKQQEDYKKEDLEEFFLGKLEQNVENEENEQIEEPYYLEPID